MAAGKEHDDMMFDVDSLQLGLSRPMKSVSYLDLDLDLDLDRIGIVSSSGNVLAARCGTRENHATLWRTAGGIGGTNLIVG